MDAFSSESSSVGSHDATAHDSSIKCKNCNRQLDGVPHIHSTGDYDPFCDEACIQAHSKKAFT